MDLPPSWLFCYVSIVSLLHSSAPNAFHSLAFVHSVLPLYDLLLDWLIVSLWHHYLLLLFFFTCTLPGFSISLNVAILICAFLLSLCVLTLICLWRPPVLCLCSTCRRILSALFCSLCSLSNIFLLSSMYTYYITIVNIW